MNLAATTTLVGAGTGLALGLFRLVASASAKPPPPKPRYRGPNGKWRTLDALGARDGSQIEAFVSRLSKLLEVDPTTPKDAAAQFHVAAYQLQRFFACLHQQTENNRATRFRVLVRKQSLLALKSLNHLATLCCTCREVEEVYRHIGELQTYVQTTALRIDK